METKTFPGVSCITTDIPTPMKCPLVHRKFGLTLTAAAEVMKETSSAPATHTLAPAIGTHTAKRESMELFTSKHGNYRYVSVIKKMKIVYLIPWTSFVVW